MSGPWEAYGGPAEPTEGPWSAYAPAKAAAKPSPKTARPIAPAKAKRPSMLEDAASGFAEPFRRLGRDLQENYRQTVAEGRAGPPGSVGEFAQRSISGVMRPVRMVGDVLGLAAAPVEAAVRPAARVVSTAPMKPTAAPRLTMTGGHLSLTAPREMSADEAQVWAEGAINGALAGARPASIAPQPRIARPTPAQRMTAEALPAAKTAAYQAAENAGVRYAPSAVDDLVDGISAEMKAANISPTRHPKASSMLSDIEAMRGSSPTLTELDQLRQVIRRDVANARDPAEAFFGRKMIQNLDEFIGAAGPGQVVAGNPERAANAITEARDLNTRLRKVEAVQDAVETAKLRAGSTGSGGNVDNALRQNLRRVLEGSRNLTADEKASLESIVLGGKGQNLLRLIGKLSPSGNGLMAALNLGAAGFGGPLGMVPGAAGMASKLAADSMTLGKIARLIDLMAAGGEAAPAVSPVAGLMTRLPSARTAAGVVELTAPTGAVLSGGSRDRPMTRAASPGR